MVVKFGDPSSSGIAPSGLHKSKTPGHWFLLHVGLGPPRGPNPTIRLTGGPALFHRINSVTVVGFVGADPELRQAKGNGSKFAVLSVATQRSWKNADDEWSSKTEWHRIVLFQPLLAERVAATIKKGAHVLVEGSLVSSTYEQSNGKGKKSKAAKITSWSIRADVVRRLDRGEQVPQAPTDEALDRSSENIPF
jgi:single-strand DNA-binding protein